MTESTAFNVSLCTRSSSSLSNNSSSSSSSTNGSWQGVTDDRCLNASWDDDGENNERVGHYQWPVLFLFTIVVLALGGNILVCLAVRSQRKLHNMFNYFLVSLALSDMLSATLVMPLSIVKALIGEWVSQLLKQCCH